MPSRVPRSAARRAPTRRVVKSERSKFVELLLANPNHFGNLPASGFKPVLPIAADTTYEQLSCVGYNPDLKVLEATVQVKLPVGFSGDLCSLGSTEYVRFFISYGAGWQDAGLASFNSHDIPNQNDCASAPDKPLTYVATLPLNPHTDSCLKPVMPTVRAILSWNLQPPAGSPTWIPIWGNVMDKAIQIKPQPILFGHVLELVSKEAIAKLPPDIQQAELIPIPLPTPPDPTIRELAQIYLAPSKQAKSAAHVAVPPHRFGFKQIQAAMGGGGTAQSDLLMSIESWKAAKVDWVSAVGALVNTKGDVTYEELDCLGLDYNAERLVATFRIKLSSGYSGYLCGPGSQEYVSFWADWNDTCQWTYLNTVKVNVHDLPIPAGGLNYSAVLPVDLSLIRRPCGGDGGGPKIARVRAVLSWNAPPSAVDPDALPYWGNRVDAHVQIRPGQLPPADKPVISILGGIGVADINVFGDGRTVPTANFALSGTPADGTQQRACPFGGQVIVQGPPLLGHKYRVLVRKAGQPLTQVIVFSPIHVVNWLGIGSWRTPDPLTGFLDYLDTLSNIDQVLGYWYSSGDEKWEVQVELDDGATTPWHAIQLDNTGPRRKPPLPPFEPPAVTIDLHIDSGGDCKDFDKGTPIDGHFVARDENFGQFSMYLTPVSLNPPNQPTFAPLTIYDETLTFAAGGSPWHLVTSNLTPCGYVVRLEVTDRSIVNSQPGSHNWNYTDVGFCLR